MYEFAYSLADENNPQFVPGQNPVIDVIPGEAGYSDLWEVSIVLVPEDYVPNTLRSAADISAADLNIVPSDRLVNRPVVPTGSGVSGRTVSEAWYQGQMVEYVDFGENPDAASQVYIFVSGFDSQGVPRIIPGPHAVFETVPGLPDYSAFCRVNWVTVPQGFAPGSLTSVADVQASGFPVTPTDILVNFPIVSPVITAVPPEQTTPPPAATSLPEETVPLPDVTPGPQEVEAESPAAPPEIMAEPPAAGSSTATAVPLAENEGLPPGGESPEENTELPGENAEPPAENSLDQEENSSPPDNAGEPAPGEIPGSPPPA